MSDDNVLVNLDKKKVTLSMILKWYQVDFGGSDKNVVKFIIDHLPKVNNPVIVAPLKIFQKNSKRAQLEELSQSKFSVDYFKYDWGTNSS